MFKDISSVSFLDHLNILKIVCCFLWRRVAWCVDFDLKWNEKMRFYIHFLNTWCNSKVLKPQLIVGWFYFNLVYYCCYYYYYYYYCYYCFVCLFVCLLFLFFVWFVVLVVVGLLVVVRFQVCVVVVIVLACFFFFFFVVCLFSVIKGSAVFI